MFNAAARLRVDKHGFSATFCFAHSMLSVVTTVGECALDRSAQLPVSLNLATSRDITLFVGGSTFGNRSWKTSRRLHSEIMFKNKNPLCLIENHFRILPHNTRTGLVLQSNVPR